ncbi:MAG: hypothetical protein ACR2O0_08770 [Rhizobiaceae bacterium]
MNFEAGLRSQMARRRLEKHNLPRKEVETEVHKILTATSEHLGVDHHWRLKYHYFAPRLVTDRTTIVFRATHRDLPYAVAVKYFHKEQDHPPSPDQTEFAVLAELHDKLDPEHRSIVARPFVSTGHGFACEWVQLPTMKTVLLAGGFSASTRQNSIEMAATSLRLMQDALGVTFEPLNTSALIEGVKRPAGTSEAWKSAFERFVELSRKFDGKMVPHASVHADYTPGNIFLGHKRCVISDFGRFGETGPVYSDGTLFLMYVITYCSFGSKRRLQKAVEEDIRTFVSAYGAEQAFDFQDFTYIYLASLIKRWGWHEARAGKTTRKFYLRAYDRFSAKRLEHAFAEVLRHSC